VRVSVVVPTYNRAHQVGDALRSLLVQTRLPHEILVVDDGSTDATEAACAQFGSAVRYVRQDNAGVSAARNHGAAIASGDFVAFLDSDDVWEPHKLEIQCAALASAPDAAWCITGCDVIGRDGAVLPERRGFKAVFGVFDSVGLEPDAFFAKYLEPFDVTLGASRHRAYRGDAYEALFLGNFVLPSSALVQRDAFLASGGFDPDFRLAEETEFFHRLAARARVVVVPASLVGYRVGQSGSLISPANTRTLILNALLSADRAAKLRPPSPGVQAVRRAGRHALLRKLAYANLSLRDGIGARQAIRELWRDGGGRDGQSLAVYWGSLLPEGLLVALHRAKRSMRARS